MKIIVTESIAMEGIEHLKAKGYDVDVKFGISRDDLLEIIDQYGNIFTDKIKNLRLAEKSPDLYQSDCVVDYFEFALTKDDVPGPYTFRIFIHTGKKVIAAVELPFNFNRG